MTKKKSFLSLVFAIALIIPCMFMMTACGGDKPVNHIGRTYMANSSSDVEFEWISEPMKAEYLATMGVESEEEAKEAIVGIIKIAFSSENVLSLTLEKSDLFFYSISEEGVLSFYEDEASLKSGNTASEEEMGGEYKFNEKKDAIVMSVVNPFGTMKITLQLQPEEK